VNEPVEQQPIAPAPAAATSSAAVPPPAAPAGTSPASASTPARGGSGLAIAAMLAATVSLIAAGALFFRDDTKREISDFRLQSLIQDQAAALSQMRQLQSDQRADARASRDQLLTRIEQLQARLEAQQQRVSQLASSDRSDWQLAEAEYFLQLANQRLLLGGDPKTALEQLQAADDIIRHIEDSGLLPTRAALAKDIAALKALEVVDVEGIYLAIEAVAEQAQQLHLIEPVTVQEQTPETLTADATLGERLQSGLHAALHKLDQLVQIRRRDEPYKPLLAPQYEAALQQNIKLAFEQAQVALLLSNQKLYEHSLSKARDALTTYYTVDEHATQIVAQAIGELMKKTIAMPLPDISQSRRELKAYLNARRAERNASNDLPRVVQ
jgi:uroporphyrin-III C-methyltransferase